MRIIVMTDDGKDVGDMELDSRHGPWSDAWQFEGGRDEFTELANRAARMEGGE